MKKYLFLFSCIALVLACKTQLIPETVSINEDKLLYNLKVISHDSMQGRFFGTEGNYKTQQFVADQFKALGIAPAFASGSIQQFPYTFKGKFRQRIYPITNPAEDYSNVPDTTVTGGNVVTMIKGKSDKAIVITAHLDHLGIKNGEIFNGADDDASGTAALLAIADHFKTKSPKHTLIFAAVDAEEIGSLGADNLLNNFPTAIENIALNINMDMIGRNDAFQLYAAGLYHYPHLRQPLDNIKSTKIELLYGHDDPNDEAKADWTFSSDHRIFHKKQIPFIYFGVEDHKDYHRPTDTYEQINKTFYISAVELIIEAIENYDSFLMDEV
ncbi:M20/M25/M40 family metallo-hydrolase [Arenibacter certesii]|uniref:Aminopeptidase n=1 Tax=Arenibacter certesii TaxID=228955 RepID=A0A918J5G6_9FLAO|nr:M20/M25/M40 family metallo-hydrolase [Arenibacter certesii]GGW49641.1 aminopeptidase [Arenibacter certesii]